MKPRQRGRSLDLQCEHLANNRQGGGEKCSRRRKANAPRIRPLDYLVTEPTGNKARVELASFYTFDLPSGKWVSERVYFDQGGLLAQMQTKQGALLK
jgi:hypothetical protein